jgi:hypothetical protein
MDQVDEAKDLGDAVVDLKTEQGFTLGPWAAFKGLLDDEGIWVMSTHVEDAVVASVGMDLREAEANARLIAAAHALYEAANAALNYIEDDNPGAAAGDAWVAGICDRLRDAIKSAKRPISDRGSDGQAHETKSV